MRSIEPFVRIAISLRFETNTMLTRKEDQTMTEHKNALKRRTILSAFLAVVLTVGLMVPFTSAQATPSAADKKPMLLLKSLILFRKS